MRAKGWLAAWIGCVVVSGSLWADDAIDSLSVIPGDAVGFVCIPNPKSLDADVQTSITKLGLAGAVPLPGNSVLSMLEAQVPPVQKMDATRPLAVVFMPADSLQGLNKSQAMLIPCQDPKALIQEFNGKQGDNETWDVSVMGTNLQASVRQKHLVLAQGAELVQQIKDSSESMADSAPSPGPRGNGGFGSDYRNQPRQAVRLGGTADRRQAVPALGKPGEFADAEAVGRTQQTANQDAD